MVTKQYLLLLMMIASAVAAMVLKPTRQPIDPTLRVDYETIIPRNFGTWSIFPANFGSIVNPQTEETLARLYSQVVTRVYLDSATGKTIMLSVAYGEEQNKQSQVHLPEVCYPAQGFQIIGSRNVDLQTPLGLLPAKRLEARAGSRTEPITYWIRTGNHIVRGGLEQKLATIREGFAGRVSDGLLFRISSIDKDPESAYQLQDRFLQDFLPAISPSNRYLLIGKREVPL